MCSPNRAGVDILRVTTGKREEHNPEALFQPLPKGFGLFPP